MNNFILNLIVVSFYSWSGLINFTREEYISVYIKGNVFDSKSRKLLFVDRKPKNGEFNVILFFNGKESGNSVLEYNEQDSNNPLDHKGLFGRKSYVDKNTDHIRLVILAPGQKKYTINFPNVKEHSKQIVLDIKDIHLLESNLPKVTQTTHSTDASGKHYFDIIFRNNLKTDLLITNFKMSAFISPKNNYQCCCPPNAIFAIDDNIKVQSGYTDKKTANINYKNLIVSSDLSMKATGSIEVGGCQREEYLSLIFATSFILPNKEYSSIRIILPNNFRVTNSFYGFGNHKLEEYGKPERSTIQNGKISHFTRYHLVFFTKENDEIEIEADISI